jgi:hypothetical protein
MADNNGNKASSQFDQYEFIGLIIPGAIFIFGLAVILGSYSLISAVKEISVGGLGLLAILAYVTGHLIAIVGGLIQIIWWAVRGMPTDRIIWGSSKDFDAGAMKLLKEKIHALLHDEVKLPNRDMPRKESFALTRRIYAAVAAAGRSTRADAFNRTYGLLRGLTAAFVLLAVVAALRTSSPIDVGNGMKVCSLYISLFLLACGGGVFYRMTHFGLAYATELFVQFLQT